MRAAPVASGAAVTLLCVAAAPLPAQQVSLFFGGVHSRYADSVDGSAANVGLRSRFNTTTLWTGLDVGFSQFTTGEWAGQAQFGAVGLHPLAPDLGVGLRMQGDLNSLEGGPWSTLASIGPFVTAGVARWQLSLAVSGGVARRVDATSDAIGTTWLRVRNRFGSWSIDASLSGTASGPTRFLDATAGIGIQTASLTAGVLVGARSGDLADDPWVQGHAEWQVAPRVTLEAAVGSYPADVTGFISGFFASGGIRVATLRRRGLPAGTPSVRVERTAPDRWRITFIVPGADRVAVAGEWNEWTPVPLERSGGDGWTGELVITPGVYRFSLVVDGDRWIVPDGVATLPDGFGGEVGVLVVR